MANKRRNMHEEDMEDMYSDNSGTLLVAKSNETVTSHGQLHLRQSSSVSSSLCPVSDHNNNELVASSCREVSSLELMTTTNNYQTRSAVGGNYNAHVSTEIRLSDQDLEHSDDPDSSSVDICRSAQSFSSTDSDICRICQLTVRESGEPLRGTGCSCKGSLRMCHRTCLHQWVKQRMRTQCELCQKSFSLRLVRIAPLRGTHQRVQDRGDEQEDTSQGCRDHRRLWFAVIFCVLALSTASAAGLITHTRRDYFQALAEARHHQATAQEAMGSQNYIIINNNRVKTHYITTKVHNAEFMYGLSAAILVCTATLTLGVGMLWIFAEFWVWPHELRMRRVRNQAGQLHNIGQPYRRPDDYQVEDVTSGAFTTNGNLQMIETSV